MNIETMDYNKNGIGTVKFVYKGNQDNLETLIKLLLKDYVDKKTLDKAS